MSEDPAEDALSAGEADPAEAAAAKARIATLYRQVCVACARYQANTAHIRQIIALSLWQKESKRLK